MKIFLDTGDVEALKKSIQYGSISGKSDNEFNKRILGLN
jgi:hypothetical protein